MRPSRLAIALLQDGGNLLQPLACARVEHLVGPDFELVRCAVDVKPMGMISTFVCGAAFLLSLAVPLDVAASADEAVWDCDSPGSSVVRARSSLSEGSSVSGPMVAARFAGQSTTSEEAASMS